MPRVELLRASFPSSAALEIAVSHALLLRVAGAERAPALRLYRPRATVAFGRVDALRPGYAAAVAAARARGFEPVLRLAGGRAAAYHDESVGFDVVTSEADARAGTRRRFRDAADAVVAALAGLGVDARMGEIPGEYCPGAYSVNARGRVKLVGTAQRVVRGGALLAGVVIVRDGGSVRDALRDVYGALELEWEETTAGAVEDEVRGVQVDAVERTLVDQLREREPLADAPLDAETLALAERLVERHRI